MKVLITGNGQLAQELKATLPKHIEALFLPRIELDICKLVQCKQAITSFNPDWIINAAAYTAVDKAESDVEQAYAVNKEGIANLAVAANEVDARIVHVSTDFVFDGSSNQPYRVTDETSPTSVYGASKLAGENELLTTGYKPIIIRTAWVYSQFENNFVKTMLRLMSEKPELGVIVDQVGTPTWAKGLAEVIWLSISKGINQGVYHWSDAGVASWYDFSVAIQELALEKGLLAQSIPIKPITTNMYPTPAKRPAYSVLDKSDLVNALDLDVTHWRLQLSAMLDELNAQYEAS